MGIGVVDTASESVLIKGAPSLIVGASKGKYYLTPSMLHTCTMIILIMPNTLVNDDPINS